MIPSGTPGHAGWSRFESEMANRTPPPIAAGTASSEPDRASAAGCAGECAGGDREADALARCEEEAHRRKEARASTRSLRAAR